ncbi:hypothetical protein HPB49_008004 [Dermacentor silvarum]|uniref:Uncharacterized protein n=1 Tax=Dermacentor silvarum TaxID=543639 RepID=A0ACB8C8C4_DERSI|nr:hypothetical protein HPB49_008004 [Dermacentor silvarum]
MSRSPWSLRQRSRFHDRCVPYHLDPAHRVATWTALDSTNNSIGWVSRLPWELPPRPLIGDSPELVPEPFLGLCSPSAIQPSRLLSTRPRKPASSVPYAARRRSPAALITQELSTGIGSPQLRFIILAFCLPLPAPWRPPLHYSVACAPTFFGTRS